MKRKIRELHGPGNVRQRVRRQQRERRHKAPTVAKLGRPATRRGPGQSAKSEGLEGQAAQTFGSLPERIFEKWLQKRGYLYQREVPALGGDVLGGARLDFVVSDLLPGSSVVVRIQGTWTHREKGLMDAHQLERLLANGYRVIDMWDQDLLAAAQRRELGEFITRQVMAQA